MTEQHIAHITSIGISRKDDAGFTKMMQLIGCDSEFQEFQECMKKNYTLHPDSHGFSDPPVTDKEREENKRAARKACVGKLQQWGACYHYKYPKWKQDMKIQAHKHKQNQS